MLRAWGMGVSGWGIWYHGIVANEGGVGWGFPTGEWEFMYVLHLKEAGYFHPKLPHNIALQ